MMFEEVFQKHVPKGSGYDDLSPEAQKGLRHLCLGVYVYGIRAVMEAQQSGKVKELLIDMMQELIELTPRGEANEHTDTPQQ